MLQAVVFEQISLFSGDVAHPASEIAKDCRIRIPLRTDLQSTADRLRKRIKSRRISFIYIDRNIVSCSLLFKEPSVLHKVAAYDRDISVLVPLSEDQFFDLYADLTHLFFRCIGLKNTDPPFLSREHRSQRIAEYMPLEMGKVRIILKADRSIALPADQHITFSCQAFSGRYFIQIRDGLSCQVKQRILIPGHAMFMHPGQSGAVVIPVGKRDHDLFGISDQRRDHAVLNRCKSGKSVQHKNASLHKVGIRDSLGKKIKPFLGSDKAVFFALHESTVKDSQVLKPGTECSAPFPGCIFLHHGKLLFSDPVLHELR